MTTDKVRETHLRHKAASFDLQLIKSRSRDPDAVDCGLYALIDPIRGAVNRALIGRYVCSWTLNVERYLSNTSNLPTHSLKAQAESVQTARVIDGAALVASTLNCDGGSSPPTNQARPHTAIVNENAVAR